MKQPYCDKCGGTEFDYVEVNRPEPERIPMSEHVRSLEQPSSMNALILYQDMKAVCKACGAEYPYTEMYGL